MPHAIDDLMGTLLAGRLQRPTILAHASGERMSSVGRSARSARPRRRVAFLRLANLPSYPLGASWRPPV